MGLLWLYFRVEEEEALDKHTEKDAADNEAERALGRLLTEYQESLIPIPLCECHLEAISQQLLGIQSP